MKVIVAQIGARHHYAIPRMLARSGHLEALYTDSCIHSGLGLFLNAIVPSSMRKGRLAKLLERRIDGVPTKHIYSTDRLLIDALLGPKSDSPSADVERAGEIFARAMMSWGTTRNATHVYSMFGEGIEFLRSAKNDGVKICVDVFITPIAHRIIAEERRRFPSWEGYPSSGEEMLEARIAEVFELADLLLCPGENVVAGVNLIAPHISHKIRIVPYGCGTDFGGRTNEPLVGRILFAGTAELRKGIHYFAAATHDLKAHRWDFRVAGGVSDQIRRLPECSGLNFLGRLSRREMIGELLSADVMVLPTLAEGSATVVNEALALGLPVITTDSAGSMISNDENGLLVRERDAAGLALGIKSIVTNRSYRQVLALSAKQVYPSLSEASWSNRLLVALKS
jgi:glycosyltransferase involved in cell wall biosynthesis